jgi:hypothetical protein
MVGETASESDCVSEPFGSGFAEEGGQGKGFYSRRERTMNILERSF